MVNDCSESGKPEHHYNRIHMDHAKHAQSGFGRLHQVHSIIIGKSYQEE